MFSKESHTSFCRFDSGELLPHSMPLLRKIKRNGSETKKKVADRNDKNKKEKRGGKIVQ